MICRSAVRSNAADPALAELGKQFKQLRPKYLAALHASNGNSARRASWSSVPGLTRCALRSIPWRGAQLYRLCAVQTPAQLPLSIRARQVPLPKLPDTRPEAAP